MDGMRNLEQYGRRTILEQDYLDAMKAEGVRLLYRSWMGHSQGGAAPRSKAKLIEGLIKDEVSIDWGRVNDWYDNLPAGALPPLEVPLGIIEQYWLTDRTMYQAVLNDHAYIPELEDVDGEHDVDPESEEGHPPGTSTQHDELNEEDAPNDDAEDLFAPDGPPSTQPRKAGDVIADNMVVAPGVLGGEAGDVPARGGPVAGTSSGQGAGLLLDEPMLTLTSLPSSLNLAEPGKGSTSPARQQNDRAAQTTQPRGSTASRESAPIPVPPPITEERSRRILHVLEAGGFVDDDYVPPVQSAPGGSPACSRASTPASSDLESTAEEGELLARWEIGPEDPMWQYYVQAKNRDAAGLFEGKDLPWEGHGVLHGQGGIVALVTDFRKDPEGKAPRVVVFLPAMWLRYHVRCRVFTVSSHTLVNALLQHPLCLEGDLYIALPVSFGNEQCVHVIGGVDPLGEVYMSPDPFHIELELLDDVLVPKTVKKTFFSISLLINRPVGTIPQKRSRRDSSPPLARHEPSTNRPRLALEYRSGIDAPVNEPALGQCALPPAKRPSVPPRVRRPATPGPAGRVVPPARRPLAAVEGPRPPAKGKQPVGNREEEIHDDEDDDEITEIPPPPRVAQLAQAPRPEASSSRPQPPCELPPAQAEVLAYLRGTAWHKSVVVSEIRASGKKGDNGSRTVDVLRKWAHVVGTLTESPTPFTDSKKARVTSTVLGAFLEHSDDWSQNAYQVYRFLQQEPTNDRMREVIAHLDPAKPMGMAALARALKPATSS
ncbi:hypothetical protein C8T65DRAFT_739112 [Cerioporus squamosus]|nr:hypothetical protein C8T65DRAFT_739112 [Cerioporus squamosus]